MSNRGIICVLCLQLTLAIIASMLGTNWIFDEAVTNDSGIVPAWYLQYGYVSEWTKKQPHYEAQGIPGPGL